MGKRYTQADPTANAAIGNTSNLDAEEMRRRARIREARDARQREAIAQRKAAEEPDEVTE